MKAVKKITVVILLSIIFGSSSGCYLSLIPICMNLERKIKSGDARDRDYFEYSLRCRADN